MMPMAYNSIFVCTRPDPEQADRGKTVLLCCSSLAQLGKQQHGVQVFQGQKRNL